uniref:Uncharacterized protein n=1 Tax=Propithecus coquereli TaxID=379532 RepID=A0A2K6FJ78_PROCO
MISDFLNGYDSRFSTIQPLKVHWSPWLNFPKSTKRSLMYPKRTESVC